MGGHQMPPGMMRYPEMPASPHGMYPPMGYMHMPPYAMDQNAPHGYGQMPMMGAYNPYYMPVPPPNSEGQGNGTVPPQNQGDMSSGYAHASGNYLHNVPPPNSGYHPQTEYPYPTPTDNHNNEQSFSSQQQVETQALE